MHRPTVDIYEDRGLQWAASHSRAGRQVSAESFDAAVSPGSLRIDVGCGAGRYAPHLGTPLIGFDASPAMLAQCRTTVPDAMYVVGDVEALPLANQSLGGAWSCMTHLHVARKDLPLALWDLHRVLKVGAVFDIQVLEGSFEGIDLPDDDVGGRFFSAWQTDELIDVVIGAGFDIDPESLTISGDELRLRALRAHTLADTVGDGMAVLLCGLNPSPASADQGVGFARPGNRFWPAALRCGLVERDRDPLHALRVGKLGMTDLVKRPTRAASELSAEEYRQGQSRVSRLVEWLQPTVVCFVGLAGWRAAVNPKAMPGIQPEALGGRPVYVMPSTSGLNGRSSLEDLTGHLQAVKDLAGR